MYARNIYLVDVDHDANVIGAALLSVADSVREATEAAVEHGGAYAAALTALLGWADGRPIDALASGLAVSHSRAVRILDALEAEGHAARRSDPEDGRRVHVILTRAGRRAARRVLAARAAAIDQALGSLPVAERAALARAAETMLAARVESREDARLVCRLCDAQACGHRDGRCPSTRAADAAERLSSERAAQ